jgi:superfamily II DNA or RNA helicase
VHLWRGNSFTDVHGAPQWFLDNLERHLSIPIDPGKREDRFGSVFGHHGELFGSLLHVNRVSAGLTPYVARPYQDKIHDAIVRGHAGVIDAPPRSGKTFMAAKAIDTFAVPTLYIAPSVAIVRQTYRVLCEFFSDDFVAVLDGHASDAEKDLSKPIVVATAASAVKLSKEFYDTRRMLIIDEFHHGAANTYHKINALAENVYYRLCFTGTHFRTGDDMLALEALCSQVLYRVSIAELVPKYLSTPRVFFIPFDDQPFNAMDWKETYEQGIVNCDARNEQIISIANGLVEGGIPTLVLTRRRAHADFFGEQIRDAQVAKGGEGALTSKSVKRFVAGDYPVLVGTTVLGEGVDLPNAGAMIYASAGSGSVQLMQSYFRPLTAHPGKSVGRVYEFRDKHHPTLQDHAIARMRMARSYLGNCVITPGVMP